MLGPSLGVRGGISSVEKLILENVPAGMDIEHVATFEDSDFRAKVLAFLGSAVQTVAVLLKRRADVLHIHFASRGSTIRKVILCSLALMFRKPVVLHAHGAEFHLFYTRLPAPARWVVRQVYRRANVLITLSKSWRNFYVENLGFAAEKVRVLPNPIRIPPGVPRRSLHQRMHLVFLGRIGERKGAFDLLLALAQLRNEERESIQLTMAGDGDHRRASELIRELGLEDCVTLRTWIGPRDRDELLAKADVFALPSYNEGLPMALLEAMAWELPSITSPVGGIPELVVNGQNGLLVAPGAVGDLVAAIRLLLHDERARRNLGRQARKSVSNLDIRTYMNELREIYEATVEKRLGIAHQHSRGGTTW